MHRKTATVTLLSMVLASAFLIGSLPMSNHMSAMRMNHQMAPERAAPQITTAQENVKSTPSDSCCDEICPFSIFLVPQTVYAAPPEDNRHIAKSDTINQTIYRESVVPPPKA